ncbi:MAG: PAS domain S-box protein, partial [Gemmatimonadales bacterium]|nr:PAS domain S-box protein [Gemmatimonadales bacterium]
MNPPADPGPRTDDADLFSGGGEMGELMRLHDWGATPLGPPAEWPSSLKTAVRICLTSRFPIVLWWGPELRLLYNDAWRPVLGATKHPQALGAPGREVWPEIWHIIGPMFAQVLASGRATWEDDQLLVLDRYGYLEEAYFTYSYSPIRLDSGEVGGVFAAVNETTGRVLAERRRETLRRLAAQASEAKSVPEACSRAAAVLADNDADVPFALLYALEVEGRRVKLAEAVRLEPGVPAAPILVSLDEAAPDAVPWPIAAALRTRTAVVAENMAEWVGLLPGGRWPQPASSAIVVPLTGAAEAQPLGVLVIGVSAARALDDDYRAFAEFAASHLSIAMANAQAYSLAQERAEALVELDRAKTAFFSNVSHEFRTPLTLMLGPLEDLLDTPDLPAVARDHVTLARRNALRLLKLVNSLLDFSRLEAGRVEAQYEPVDLAGLTSDLAGTFRPAIERAGLRLVVDCRALPTPVYVDRGMWEKIVLNLLSNAFKFTFEGEIGVVLRRQDGLVTLSVSDTGTGIAPEELPHVFERFRQVQNARARTQEGTGIGLALVHELVKLHGGQVALTSEVGSGTTFSVTLPAGSAHLPPSRVIPPRTVTPLGAGPAAFVEEALRWLPADPLTEEATDGDLLPGIHAGQRQGPASSAPARILFADDNPDMREYVGRLLGARWSVETVADGRVAFAQATADPPDLLLSDVMMPGLDGFTLLQALRADARTHELPIILLSARAGEESRVEGLQAGADDYLVKPFSARELLARVGATLEVARVRRQAAAALRESEQRFRTIVSQATVGVVQADATGRMTLVNQRWCEMLGYSETELLRMSIADVAHPDSLASTLDAFGRLAEGGPDFVIEEKYRRKDGSTLWATSSVNALRSATGESQEWVAVVVDITDRKRAEEALRRQTAQFETLLAEAPLGVYLIDDAFRIIEVNPTALPVFGDIPDLIGRDFDEVIHVLWPKVYADEVVRLFRHTLETGEPYATPEQIEQRLDRGVTEYYEWQINRIQLPGGRYGVVCYFRDISAQVFAQAKVAESQERLRQAAKMEAVGRLAGGIAHDFNNQLQGVSGFASFVAQDPGLGSRARQDLEEIQKATERMAGLTRHLLAFSRQQVLQPETLDLNAAVTDGQSLLQRLIGTNIEMVLELLPQPLWVRADRAQLLQVLMNLAINARDAMPEGGRLTLRTAVHEVSGHEPLSAAGTTEPGRYAQLAVTDAGVGIPPADLPHIFEPFFTTKEVGQGTGLGLATVYGIVSQSHG